MVLKLGAAILDIENCGGGGRKLEARAGERPALTLPRSKLYYLQHPVFHLYMPGNGIGEMSSSRPEYNRSEPGNDNLKMADHYGTSGDISLYAVREVR